MEIPKQVSKYNVHSSQWPVNSSVLILLDAKYLLEKGRIGQNRQGSSHHAPSSNSRFVIYTLLSKLQRQ